MDIKLLDNIVLKNKTSLSYRNGEKLFEKNSVKSIDIRELNGDTIIYGVVQEGISLISTYIRLNKNGKLQLKCNCEINKEARLSGGQFACMHIVATVLKLTKNLKINEYNSKSEKARIEIMPEKSFDSSDNFNIFLYLK